MSVSIFSGHICNIYFMRLLYLSLIALAITTTALASPQSEAAQQLFHDRKDAEAKVAFGELAKREARNADAQFYLGRLAMRAKEFDAAVTHFEKAISLDGNRAAYHLELAGAYGAKVGSAGLLGKASLASKSRKALENAVALEPNNVDARSGLVQFYSQAPSMMGGGMDKAHAQADVILQLNPARGRTTKAALFAREKKYDEAFALFAIVLQEAPDDYNALYQTGRLAAESGVNLDVGLAALQRCLAMEPPAGAPGHAAAHWRVGNIHEKLGDKSAARAAYEASLARDAKFAQAIASLKKLN
ncbi:MAG: tetratricopeptide repeat protein [Candidatus Didemnitutus sp.]|nr:tetratricopeptide repeat protein [Candidatus Didemnitutus sp.]